MTDPADTAAALQEADRLYKENQFPDALEKYTTLLEKNQEDIELLLRRSRCYYGLKEFNLAFKDAKAAHNIDATHIDACICCGRAATRTKSFEKAFRYYKDALKVDPKHPVVTEDLKKLQGAIMAEHEKEVVEEPTYSAVKFCTQDPYPGDKELYQMEQEILNKKHKISNNQEIAPPVPNTKPEDAAKHAAMAIRYRAGGNTGDALQECYRSVAIDPYNVLYRQLRAEVLLDRSQREDSLRDLFAIPPPSRSVEVWKQGGQILLQMGLPVSSEFWFRKATKISDNKDEESAILFQKVRTERLYGPLTQNVPVKVDFGQFGRSIFATENIEEGAECLTDKPVVMAESINNNLVPGCHHCAMSLLSPEDYFGEALDLFDDSMKDLVKELWPDTTPVLCKTCERVKYCSVKCHDEAWAKYHEVICPGRNPAAKRIYDLAASKGVEVLADGRTDDVWVGSYSPLVLARIWGTIVQDAKTMMRSEGLTQPSAEHWAKAKAPFRRFIAFGCTKATDKMPEMIKVFQEIFQNCGDGISYEITEAEFNGRYYQATCNLQIFTSYITPYQHFLTNVANKGDPRGLKMLKYLQKNPKPSAFTGMFALHACLNHSCYNNVEVRDGRCADDKPGVAVIAKRDVKKGEEVLTTYIDTSMPRRLRRAWLYKSFNFWCHCLRCQYEGDDATSCTTCRVKVEEGKKFPSCGKCHRAWYCSVACQKKAWKQGHKIICQTDHSQVNKLQ
ncbi:uncharacterized protein [Haliotis cracherodii]|uniref:uncharacterized protein isoform X1 n=1 Tax=Haliotis cracherodii TaxID=6455 RepID=UPI0039E743F9